MSLNLGTLTVRLVGRDAQFRATMGRTSRSLARVQRQLVGVSVAAAAAFAPIAVLGKSTLQAAGDFERGMVRAAAIAQVKSAKIERALSRTVLGLAAKTEFTARQVADASTNLAQLGFSASEIMGALPASLELASAATMDVAQASAIAAKIMRSQGFATRDLARVNDVLVSSYTGAAIDIQSLGESFKFVGSIGKVAGVEFEELAAALGQLGNVGVPAEIAGTGLRRMIAGLLGPTGKTKRLLDELGLSALMASSEGFPKLADIVEVLEQRLAGASDEGEIAGKVMNAFGQRAGPVLLSLVNVGSGALRKFTGRLRESGGLAREIAQKQLNTFTGRMKILASQAEGLAISLGNALIPMMDRLTGAVSGAIGYFRQLPKATQQGVVQMLAFAAGVLGALTATSLLLSVLSPLIGVVSAVGRVISLALTKPLLAAAAAMAGVILLLGSFRQAWNADLGGLKTAWQSFETFLSGSLSRLDAKFGAWLGKRKQWMADLGESLMSAFGGVERVEIIDPKTGEVSGSEFRQTGPVRSKDLAALGVALAASSGDTKAFQAIDGALGRIVDALPKKSDRAPGPAGKGVIEQTRQDIVKAFEDGLDVLKPVLGKVSEMGSGLSKEALKGIIGAEEFEVLAAKIKAAGGEISAFIEALKSGSIGTALPEREAVAAAKPSKVLGLLFPDIMQLRRATAMLEDQFNRTAGSVHDLGRFGKRLRRELGQLFGDFDQFFGKSLNITPTVMRDETGAASFDAGSLLGGSKVGGIIQGAGQGALAGGPMGAVIGALAAILLGAEKFQNALEYVGDTLGVVGDALAEFEGPLESLHGQMRILTETAVKPLANMMSALGDVLALFTPIIAALVPLFEAVNVILEPFADYIRIFAEAIGLVVNVVVAVLRWVILGILYVVKGIATAWNAIIGAIEWVFRQLAKLPIVGKLFDKVAGWFDSLQVSTDGLDNALRTLRDDVRRDPFGTDFVNRSYEEGARKFNAGADAAERAGEALKNVPEGYKVALRRFQSMMPREAMSEAEERAASLARTARGGASDGNDAGRRAILGLATGGIVTGPTLAVVGEGQGPEAVIPLDRLHEFMGGGGGGGMSVHIGHLELHAEDPDDMLRQLQARASRQQFLRNGMSEPGAPRYTGR